MRLSARRTSIGAAVLMAGILGLNQTLSEAADTVPESEFKALFEQDSKNIAEMITLGKSKEKAKISRATHATKINAMMIAYYANSQITGKSADDGKMAALRDAAVEVAKAAGKKDFTEAGNLAKTLSLNMPAGKDTKAIEVAALAKADGMDIDELMYQFKKPTVGGLGIEEEIKANAKKNSLSPAKLAALAARIQAVCDYSESVTVEFDAKKTKKDWDLYNKDMRTAAQGLLAVANSKNAKSIQTALTKLDGSCVACHEKMK